MEHTKNYNRQVTLVWKCILSEDKNERIEYGKKLIQKIKETDDLFQIAARTTNDCIEKMTEAASTIQKQNLWIECLKYAMGDQEEAITEKALFAQSVIEKHKERLKNASSLQSTSTVKTDAKIASASE